nr:lipoprotein insertase outer membrane protein LolB [Ramlibacter albus]
MLLAGCAQPALRPTDAAAQFYRGRLALQVEGQQSQSFSASFELQGNAREGELSLSAPIGGTVAQLAWNDKSATLRQGGQTREFHSLDELAAQATGTPLPIAALFDWLRGVNTPAPGWEVDLSQLAEGRLRARRSDPPPAADLRVALER